MAKTVTGAGPTEMTPEAVEKQRGKQTDPGAAQKVGSKGTTTTTFAFGDASDAYANHKQLFLSFYQFAADDEVAFKGFIISMNQNFAADYAQEQVFGRNDPILTFKSTTRKANISFQIPAASLQEAKLNLAKCNRLTQFMYPAYESSARADTLAKPPLMRVAFANLIRDPAKGASPRAKEAGMLCAISTLNITPSFDDEGFFDPGIAQLYPKLITIDVDMTILHERDLGWDANGRTDENAFGFSREGVSPYPFGMEGFDKPKPAPIGENEEKDKTDADRAQAEADGERIDGSLTNQQTGPSDPDYEGYSRRGFVGIVRDS